MKYSWAVPGQQVICIDALWLGEEIGLVDGAVYTISETAVVQAIDHVGRVKRGLALRFDGVKKTGAKVKTDFFDADRFKPAIKYRPETCETAVKEFANAN